MPKPTKFSYEKRTPFRDAFLVLIVCEGTEREVAYFRFFDGMSSRLKIITVTSEKGSAPKHMAEAASAKLSELTGVEDKVWFVVDTDRWRAQLHALRQECMQRDNWFVAQSNPCFEVWLYYHAKAQMPPLEDMLECKNWKPYLPKVIHGGFNLDCHPAAIEAATQHAKAAYEGEGFSPKPGSTQVWQLSETLLPLIKKNLDILKDRFPAPSVFG